MLTFVSCGGGESEEEKVVQGRIHYEISYPYNDGKSLLSSMLPTHMVMTFKGPHLRIAVEEKVLSNVIITDETDKSLLMLFRFSSKKMACQLNEDQIRGFLSQFPEVEYIETGQTMVIAGYDTKKITAVFMNASREVELFYTDDIKLPNPNWPTPYKEISGVLLQYDIQKYGLTMRFTAKKVEMTSIPDSEFEAPSDFKRTSFKDLEQEIITMFSQVQDNM